MSAPSVRRKKIRKTRSPLRRYWWLAPVLLGVATIGWIATGPRWSRPRIPTPVEKPMKGYVATTPTLTEEYAHFYGKPLNDAATERSFEQASQFARTQAYLSAAGLLEQVSQVAAVPVVFNNLGVVFAELGDTSSAVNAFREALMRDAAYPAVRLNLDRLRNVMALNVDPVAREVEPNNDLTLANIIALGKAVEGEMDSAFEDKDFFRLVTPPAPPDLISIEIINHSKTLVPALKIFDSERRVTEWGKTMQEPGSSLQKTIAPAANTTLYLGVSGSGGSAGAYTLLVKPKNAGDVGAQ